MRLRIDSPAGCNHDRPAHGSVPRSLICGIVPCQLPPASAISQPQQAPWTLGPSHLPFAEQHNTRREAQHCNAVASAPACLFPTGPWLHARPDPKVGSPSVVWYRKRRRVIFVSAPRVPRLPAVTDGVCARQRWIGINTAPWPATVSPLAVFGTVGQPPLSSKLQPDCSYSVTRLPNGALISLGSRARTPASRFGPGLPLCRRREARTRMSSREDGSAVS